MWLPDGFDGLMLEIRYSSREKHRDYQMLLVDTLQLFRGRKIEEFVFYFDRLKKKEKELFGKYCFCREIMEEIKGSRKK